MRTPLKSLEEWTLTILSRRVSEVSVSQRRPMQFGSTTESKGLFCPHNFCCLWIELQMAKLNLSNFGGSGIISEPLSMFGDSAT